MKATIHPVPLSLVVAVVGAACGGKVTGPTPLLQLELQTNPYVFFPPRGGPGVPAPECCYTFHVSWVVKVTPSVSGKLISVAAIVTESSSSLPYASTSVGPEDVRKQLGTDALSPRSTYEIEQNVLKQVQVPSIDRPSLRVEVEVVTAQGATVREVVETALSS
jgi:hypothetical protein